MTDFELREIKGVRWAGLKAYHEAVHGCQLYSSDWFSGYYKGKLTALYLQCKLLRRLHRWAVERYRDSLRPPPSWREKGLHQATKIKEDTRVT